MNRKIVCLLLMLSSLILLPGCWNYRGLNDMTVVSGMALDKDEKSGDYDLTFEFIDTSVPIKDKGPSGKNFTETGKTIFDAIRNAKQMATNRLYFSHAQIVISSEKLARSGEMSALMDFFLRDQEMRETMCVAISEEGSAKDIYSAEGLDQSVLSIELHKMIQSDEKIGAATQCVEVYEMIDTLNTPGKSLVIPVIQCVKQNEKTLLRTNGLAVFKGDKMVGTLSPEETKYFLFATDSIQGGLIPISLSGDGPPNATLEISSSQTKRDFQWENEKGKIILQVKAKVYLAEIIEPSENAVLFDEQMLNQIKGSAEKQLEGQISGVIQKVQSEYDSDIFGFGELIYKKNNSLWKQLEGTWDELFSSLEVEVHADIHIVNTGVVKKT